MVKKSPPVKQGKKQGSVPPEEYRFKPGKSGNPNGRPVLTKMQRELRTLSLENFARVIEVIFNGGKEDLLKIMEDPESTVLEVSLAASVVKAIKSGDYSVIERIVERVVGKIPEVIKLHSTGTQAHTVLTLTDVELRARLDRIRKDI